MVAQFATAKAGLILVNLNPAYRTAELEYALGKVACKALITAVRFKTSDYLEMLYTLLPELGSAEPGALRSAKLPSLRCVIELSEQRSPGMLSFARIADQGGEAERRRIEELVWRLQFDEPVNIQFTSGTTGPPKAATLTHHNIVNNAALVARNMRFTEHDRLCIPVPMYHCFGMVLGTLACVTQGATMVLPSEGFDAR